MNTAAAGRRASRRGHVAAGVAACALLLAACSSNKDAVKPTPLAEIRGAIPVRTVWRASLPKAPDAFMQPAVTDDAVYAAGGDGTIVRLDPSSGRVVWRVDAKSPLSAGVGSDGTTVAVATAKGEVLAYGSDGKPRWKAQVASDVVVPPLVGRGLVVVRSTDHRISAFSSDSGKREWMYQRQTPPLSLRVSTPLVFDGDNVVGGFPGGRLVAVSLANGAMRWEATVSEPNGATEVERLADVTGSIAVGARDLCAASYQGRVMCIDATGTGERWARTLAAGAGVAFDDQRVFAVDQASAVVAYTRDAGASVWRTSALANRRLSSPLAQGRWVAVGDFEGYVHFLAAADGALIARAKTDGTAIVAAPQALADGVVVQTRDGSVELLVPGAR